MSGLPILVTYYYYSRYFTTEYDKYYKVPHFLFPSRLCYPQPEMIIHLLGVTSFVSLVLLLICITSATSLQSAARHPSKITLNSHGSSVDRVIHNDNDGDDWPRVYFDIAIPSSPPPPYSSSSGRGEYAPLGRLTFRLVPPSHPRHLPLHASNLSNLASGVRRSVDPLATYVGCEFRHSPASVEDGSARYRWGHICDGRGRNGIRTTSASGGGGASWDAPFSDPHRLKSCSHGCFGGVYYGMSYGEVLGLLPPPSSSDDDAASTAVVLLTVPIHGPGAGTSKFSIVRVGESPREWGERLLHSSAVLGYLDCGVDGSFGGGADPGGDNEDDDGTQEVAGGGGPAITALGVLREMASLVRKCDAFAEDLNAELSRSGLPVRVRNFGNTFSVDFLSESLYNSRYPQYLLAEGMFLGNYSTGKFNLSADATRDDLRRLGAMFVSAAERMMQHGYFEPTTKAAKRRLVLSLARRFAKNYARLYYDRIMSDKHIDIEVSHNHPVNKFGHFWSSVGMILFAYPLIFWRAGCRGRARRKTG